MSMCVIKLGAFGNECAGLGFSANTTVIDPFAPLSNNGKNKFTFLMSICFI